MGLVPPRLIRPRGHQPSGPEPEQAPTPWLRENYTGMANAHVPLALLNETRAQWRISTRETTDALRHMTTQEAIDALCRMFGAQEPESTGESSEIALCGYEEL